MQSALLLQNPDVAEQMGQSLAELFPETVDAVLSPALGGLIIGHEVGRAKKCRAIFAEKDDAGQPVLRRGFEIKPGEKILVIEDVITTGLSTTEVVNLVKKAKGNVIGIGAIVNRSGKQLNELFTSAPAHSLLEVNVKTWDAKDCELCKKGIPAVKPGSRKK
jgi:orotate phosphoribosyltransferase